MLRNEDFFFLRFGNSDFIRRHIAANGHDFVGGYAIGSEGFIPAEEYAYPPESSARSWRFSFEKQWLFYQQWGSLLYDPSTPEEYFESHYKLLYPHVAQKVPDLGRLMVAGYNAACEMPLTFARFIYNTWDFTLHSEGFLQPVGNPDKSSGGFVSVKTLSDKRTRTLDPTLENVYSFVHSRNITLISPLQVASNLEADAHTAERFISGVIHAAAMNLTLLSEVNDIKAWVHLGRHFAFKIRGAVEYETYRSSKTKNTTLQMAAVRHLRAAQEEWAGLVNVTSVFMAPEIPLLDLGQNYTFHWRKFAGMAARDVRLAEQL